MLRAFIARDGDLPQYRLEIDRAAAARHGLNVMDVQEVIETALAGKAATELWEGDRHFSVVVRLKNDERALDRLREVLIPTSAPRPNRYPSANRVLAFAFKNWDGHVPAFGSGGDETPPLRDGDKNLLAVIEEGFNSVGALYNAVKLRDALKEALRLATEVNRYLDRGAMGVQVPHVSSAAVARSSSPAPTW